MAGSVVGTALQLQQAALWDAKVYAVLVAIALTGWLLLRKTNAIRACSWRQLAFALSIGAMAGLGLTGWRAAIYADGALDPSLEGRDLQVVGVVAQMPQHGDGAIRFQLDVESAGWASTADRAVSMPRIPAALALGWYANGTGLWGRGATETAIGGAQIAAPGPLHAGERWRFTVRLKAPHGNLNPYGFDQELWMWEQGMPASGYVRTGKQDATPERLAMTWAHPVERAREAVRDAILARIDDRRLAGVVAALVTGDQAAIERADWDVFRATGVAHLVAISGLHITMFAWLAALAIGTAWRRSTRLMLWIPAQQAALAGGVCLAGLYALFSGWGVPSQRTIWMLAAVALLRLSGRRWPWPFVWLLACAVVVAIDPWALMQAGFWLSFVAVAALFATDAAENVDANNVSKGGWRQHAMQMVREQGVVTLALTPLTLLLFQQFSVVGLLANALAIPWVTLVVTPLAMLGVALPAFWDLAALSVQAMAWVLQRLAALPFAAVSMAAPPLWLAMAGIAGGVLIAMRLPWALRLLGLPLLLPVLLWQLPRPASGEFDLLAADIGQGNAVLVRTATHSLLYDAGPRYSLESDAGHRVLVPLLRALGERIDLLVLSHRDSDHTGGAAAVLATQPQAELLSSIEATHPLQALRPVRRCVAGQRWEWDGVVFEVLHPLAGDASVNGGLPKPNAVSCVLRVGNGRASVLLAGDIERPQELALVARGAPGVLQADLLLVPHHGSKTSSTVELLTAVRPKLAIVQAGYRNRFGHPAPVVLETYAAQGVTVINSPHCGAAKWSSVAPLDVRCEREARARYWHHQVP
ncbi:DNA internalization-related competence protein ComEC/Rec2 [Variovorax sp. RHLX14]|uniref:DNA internalization-related competence protein ComEC/Rec2 n=1 Tax=Variovorax sp. RHLX14 TaxID=1259731 RepID=UPI003F45893F